MGFVTAVRTCFQKYFDFSGRARRSEFWYWALFAIIVEIALTGIELVLFGGNGYLVGGFILATLLPGLAVSVRRLHDIERSGWWLGGGYIWFIVSTFVYGIALDTPVRLFSRLFSENNTDFYVSLLVTAMLFILLIGYLIWIVTMLVFFSKDTKAGENRYGLDLKYNKNAIVFD